MVTKGKVKSRTATGEKMSVFCFDRTRCNSGMSCDQHSVEYFWAIQPGDNVCKGKEFRPKNKGSGYVLVVRFPALMYRQLGTTTHPGGI